MLKIFSKILNIVKGNKNIFFYTDFGIAQKLFLPKRSTQKISDESDEPD